MKLPPHILYYVECYTPSAHSRESNFYEIILVLGTITLSLANVFAKKVITIFGVKVALSGVIFPFTFLFLAIINEIYGHQRCGRAIVAMLIGQFFFLLLLWQFSLIPFPALTESSDMINQSLLNAFGLYKQVILGSMLAVSVSFYFFSILNSYLKIKLCEFSPVLRFLISSGISKFLLVVAAYSMNLWKVVTLAQLVQICAWTWLLKMFIAFFVVTLSIPIISKLKNIEKIDIYDIDTSFNPIKLYSSNNAGLNLYETIEQNGEEND